MKNSKKTIFIALFAAIALAAVGLFLAYLGTTVDCPTGEEDEEEHLCACPTVNVSLLPLGDFTKKEAENLKKELENNLTKMLDVALIFDVQSSKPLDDSWLNDKKSRYRANKIIESLEKDTDKNHIIIALTHKDVSTTYKGNPDWGVLGLSLIPKKACVVSTFRLKNSKDLWKLTSHEFIHTCFEYQHCPDDVNTCIMKDAKGHANFSNKSTLCDKCKQTINAPYL